MGIPTFTRTQLFTKTVTYTIKQIPYIAFDILSLTPSGGPTKEILLGSSKHSMGIATYLNASVIYDAVFTSLDSELFRAHYNAFNDLSLTGFTITITSIEDSEDKSGITINNAQVINSPDPASGSGTDGSITWQYAVNSKNIQYFDIFGNEI